ncbi:MAG TPA: ABC transporter transmembrane domain-containing protein [Cyclobacteriaceae bacterium]|nr:ATP-binding cassette domain-containing protein [Cyclobacteriaceae bacterium]HMV07823.1 ABC transporter transmembrane domain-containing protein [Cyclobacteriaceae bacterium]HMV88091.1 ABC transporter transmembrane domain-containing protein [Cyclobacteriaceae bacterium]HMW98957.1 ABC transporter transmembrane domain-containing protein [Cyclobacteriaceae bacterium]HMX48409.1 ABC transporter transmembrane domain-containing protein [Cyclobacteriaceae bacterium]
MAKRSHEPLRKEEKRKLDKAGLKKLAGIFRFMLPYKGLFILGLMALGLSTFTIMAFPKLAGELVDVATGSSKYFSTIEQVVITLVIVLFIQSIFSFIRVYTFSNVSERGIADVRKAVYQKILWLPMTFFDSRRTGELMSRITSDVATLQDTFSFTLAEFFRQVLSLIFGTIIIFYLTPSLALFMLLTFPVIVVAALIFGTYIRKLSRKTQDKLAEVNVIVEESFQSIFVVKAFTNELFQINKFTKALQKVVMVAIRSSLYRSLFVSFVIFVLFGGIVAIGWHGANLVQTHELQPGELFSFVFYTAIIGFSIAGLGDIYAQLQRAIGASERVLDILALQDEAEPIDDQRLQLSGEIVFDNVSFSYPSRVDYPVLKDLNFKIKTGEKIALVGKSGSGKSTIINLLMRFYPVTEGSIVVDGVDIQSYHLTGYRHNLGVVPQEVILFGGTIEENIAYGKPGASLEEVTEAARKANALEFIERFPEGFKTLVGERGVKLSGGQRQRIAIARAILKDPAILVLDEATSSLDAQSEVLVQQALEKLMEGRTTIVIAHRLSTIKKVDRIFVINEGRLAEMGSHAELTQVNNGIYSTLLKLQLHES